LPVYHQVDEPKRLSNQVGCLSHQDKLRHDFLIKISQKLKKLDSFFKRHIVAFSIFFPMTHKKSRLECKLQLHKASNLATTLQTHKK